MNYVKAEDEIKSIISNSSNILQDVVNYLYENIDHYSWVGIYIVEDNALVLGPWKGPHATKHTRIPIGQGICGSAAKSGKIARRVSIISGISRVENVIYLYPPLPLRHG